MSHPDISIIIPCYKEAPHLEASVASVVFVMSQIRYSYELVFVEDCSPDSTKDVLKRLELRLSNAVFVYHSKNEGRGKTVMDGFRASSGRVVGFLDIDLEVAPSYLPHVVGILMQDKADVVSGMRHFAADWKFTPILRLILSLGYRKLFSFFLDIPVKDPETGYKFFRRECFETLAERVFNPGWFWDSEVMAQAYLGGYRISELPCLFLRRADKQTTVNIVSYTIRHFRELLNYRKTISGKERLNLKRPRVESPSFEKSN